MGSRRTIARVLGCAGLLGFIVALPRGARAQSIDHSSGFGAHADLSFQGSARVGGTTGTALALTDGTRGSQTGSVFSAKSVNVTTFSATFGFHLHPNASGGYGDGITFTLENSSANALGSAGGNLGYTGIPNSFAIKFDTYQNSGDPSADSMGWFTGGNAPFGGNDMTGYVNLQDHDMRANVEYDGSTLRVNVFDDTTNTYYAWYWLNVDIAGMIGSKTAYVGFTGATGASVGMQEITSFTYRAVPPMTMVDLGTLSTSPCFTNPFYATSQANDINDLGQVVGASDTCFDATHYTVHAFLFNPESSLQDLHTLSTYNGLYLGQSGATAINNVGDVVGASWRSQNYQHYVMDAFHWTAHNGMQAIPTLSSFYDTSAPWLGTGDPPSPGNFEFAVATGVNDSGQIVGYFEDGSTTNDRAFQVLAGGSASRLGTGTAEAFAVNGSGLAVGQGASNGQCALFQLGSSSTQTQPAGCGVALESVNAQGAAVGGSSLWLPAAPNSVNGSATNVAPSYGTTAAHDINDDGLIVGAINDDGYVRLQSTLDPKQGTWVALNLMAQQGLIQGVPSGAWLDEALAVNNLGQIVGHLHPADTAYLLTPTIVPELQGTNVTRPGLARGVLPSNLQVTGTKLLHGAQVYVNGQPRTSTRLDKNHVRVNLVPSDVAASGTLTITVANPVPGSALQSGSTLGYFPASAGLPVPVQ